MVSWRALYVLAFLGVACDKDSPGAEGVVPTGSTSGSAQGGTTSGGAVPSAGSSAIGGGTGGAAVGVGGMGLGGNPGNGAGGAGGGQSRAGAGQGGSGQAGAGQGGAAGGTAQGGAGNPSTAGAPFVFTVNTAGAVRAFSMNEADGSLAQVASLSVDGGGDHFLAVGPSRRQLFVAYEEGVSAIAFDPGGPSLALLDDAETFGAGTHVGVDATGAHVVTAAWSQGNATYLHFDGAKFSNIQEWASGEKTHAARFHPTEPLVFIPVLGDNKVAQYRVNATSLSPATPASVSVSGGPRHMTFHPSLDVAYVLSELSGDVHTLAVDRGAGSLGAELDVDALGSSAASDVQVTPNGQHLYAVGRAEGRLYHFEIASDGTLSAAAGGIELSGVVRAFGMDPKGKFLQVGDSNGDVRAYQIGSDGALTASGTPLTKQGNVYTTEIAYVE